MYPEHELPADDDLLLPHPHPSGQVLLTANIRTLPNELFRNCPVINKLLTCFLRLNQIRSLHFPKSLLSKRVLVKS